MTRIMITIDSDLHASMRELAIRRRHNVGEEYTRALSLYLSRVENYLGVKPKTPNPKPITKKGDPNGNDNQENIER